MYNYPTIESLYIVSVGGERGKGNLFDTKRGNEKMLGG
jgi:hypothetical protein